MCRFVRSLGRREREGESKREREREREKFLPSPSF